MGCFSGNGLCQLHSVSKSPCTTACFLLCYYSKVITKSIVRSNEPYDVINVVMFHLTLKPRDPFQRECINVMAGQHTSVCCTPDPVHDSVHARVDQSCSMSMQVVSLCPPNVHKLKTTAGTSLPSAVESSSSSSYSQLTGSSSHGNSDYSRSHGSSGYANPSNSGYNSHTNSASGQSHTGSYGNTTTQAATAHQDGCPPRPLDVSDSSEMDADKDIAELLGMLSPEQPTSLQW